MTSKLLPNDIQKYINLGYRTLDLEDLWVLFLWDTLFIFTSLVFDFNFLS